MRNKQVKPYKNDKQYRKYSSETMVEAFQAVKSKGMSVRMAARMFKVPAQTLRDRVKGFVNPYTCHVGAEMIFTPEEELTIIEHLEAMAQHGYGYSVVQLLHVAGELAYTLGRRPSSKPLSERWYRRFCNKWSCRIALLKSQIWPNDNHNGYLDDILLRHKMKDKPQFVYCLNETSFRPEPGLPEVTRSVNNGGQEETVAKSVLATVITCVNGIGNSVPPYFVYRGSIYSPDLMQGSTPGAKGVMSETGCPNSQIFQVYLEKHFMPNVPRGETDKQPILLIYTSHTSYVSEELTKWAECNNLILLELQAGSHLLQPLGVSVFEPFKTYYNSECETHRKTNGVQNISQSELCELTCKAFLTAMTPGNIISGFKRMHIYPECMSANNIEKQFPIKLTSVLSNETSLEKSKHIKSNKDEILKFLLEMSINYMEQKKWKKRNGKCSGSVKKSTSGRTSGARKRKLKSVSETSVDDESVCNEENTIESQPKQTMKLKIKKMTRTNNEERNVAIDEQQID